MTHPAVYLAGPMSGLPGNNLDAFRHAARRLRDHGYRVLNPAEIDDGGRQREWTWYMRRCLPLVCEADLVATLHGWQRSRGASLEVFIACQLGLRVLPWGALIHRNGLAEAIRQHRDHLTAHGYVPTPADEHLWQTIEPAAGATA